VSEEQNQKKAARHYILTETKQRASDPETFELPNGVKIDVYPPTRDEAQKIQKESSDQLDLELRFLIYCAYVHGSESERIFSKSDIDDLRDLPDTQEQWYEDFANALSKARGIESGMTEQYALRGIKELSEGAISGIEEEPDEEMSPENKSELTETFQTITDLCEEGLNGDIPTGNV